mmetsp:Transcript_17110/g.30185  ORF Transcript_17110/g.30185 Transcript_17110/m.30185 type:complete len:237 (+) Transcript_17110:288-998(+)|eukprot:CAMPEP_0184517226 /NCGR_PEP_ID=MMETSP0198_2-20121128/5445_1 /TAXON_ID=1112570 /ORGANISM="Thraustochytrium sp., Strain LLF1b" /LENGTH=236 /DNA_ID=CAMNT_0026907591 /DNA_START=359 /DNA_END=1069 /DNA_ORIENTATION=+
MADELIALFGKITTTDHETLVDQFSKVLQVDQHVATFFLEASSWNVETAVHNYLASQGPSSQNRANVIPLTTTPKAAFAGDLAPWQSRSFVGGTRLPIRLHFQNLGNEPWPQDTCLVHMDGERMDGFSEMPLFAEPGQTVEVLLVLTVPQQPGAHIGTWRLVCSAGYFGDPTFMIVNSNPDAQPVVFAREEFYQAKLGHGEDQAQVDSLLDMANNINLGSNPPQQPSMQDTAMGDE